MLIFWYTPFFSYLTFLFSILSFVLMRGTSPPLQFLANIKGHIMFSCQMKSIAA